eukprot:m.212207 g.212207  ORF g.212207 m.212207 type:complete len:94 (-) comp17157_c1_seq67:1077-1358(-)
MWHFSSKLSRCSDGRTGVVALVRFWQGADCQATYSGHTRSITSIASLPNDSNGARVTDPFASLAHAWCTALDVVSASMDESIRIWQTSRSDPR